MKLKTIQFEPTLYRHYRPINYLRYYMIQKTTLGAHKKLGLKTDFKNAQIINTPELIKKSA